MSVDFLVFSIHLLGVSSMLNSFNWIGTTYVSLQRMSSSRLPNCVRAFLLSSLLLILVLPVLAAGVSMLLFDRCLNCCFFDTVGGGDVVLFQTLFWLFGHPEVYVIIIPGFGIISNVIETHRGIEIHGKTTMTYSLISICILGMLVWAHHMFVIGMDTNSRSYFSCISIVIAIPTSIKLFNWFNSLIGSDVLSPLPDLLYSIAFLLLFLVGGISGLFLANQGLDILLHDTYFVIAHFHFVMSLGASTAALSACYHYMSTLVRLEYNVSCSVLGLSWMLVGSRYRKWDVVHDDAEPELRPSGERGMRK